MFGRIQRKGEVSMNQVDKEQKHIFSFHFSHGENTKTIRFHKRQAVAILLAATVIVGGGCYMAGTYLNTKKDLQASVAALKQTEKNQEALQKKAALLEIENKKYTEHIAEIESKANAIEEKVADLEKTKEDLYNELEKVSKNSEVVKETSPVARAVVPTETVTAANVVQEDAVEEGTHLESSFIPKIQTAFHKVDAISTTLQELEKEVDLEHLSFMNVSETVTETVAILTAPFGAPTEIRKITTEFDPNGLQGRVHKGLDVCAYLDHPVMATASGTVVEATYHSGYGYYVKIDHGNGFTTLYAHNNSLNVQVGDVVTKGDTIALAGSTGDSSGVHVHYEIMYQGVYQDPRDYM